MPQPSELLAEHFAAETRSALAQRRTLNIRRHDLSHWRAAINVLITSGEFDAAAYAARYLEAAAPKLGGLRMLRQTLEAIPRDPPRSALIDNPASEVQIVPSPGADTLLLLFADVNHMLGLPFAILHRWLSLLPASLVYLRDLSNRWFTSGIASLGPDRPTTLSGLRSIASSLGVSRIVCYGNSIGGYAALSYGIDLGADAVLTTGGATDLTALKLPLGRKLALEPQAIDLRKALATAEHPPNVLCVVGDGNWDDRLHADHIADLPTVRVRLMEQFDGHHLPFELMQRKLMPGVLDWLMHPDASADKTAPLR